jgi:Protein of unknown function (DUF3644)
MPKGLSQKVKDNLEKCTSAALAAVEAYNRPGPRFRTAQFLILIVLSWTGLFHAIFFRRGRNPWYRSRGSGTGRGVRYTKVDGEPKHWDLSECLKQYYGDQNPPERKNLEFLIGLRNKIEHRQLPQLDSTLYGECQACLLNLEQLLVTEFGARYGLTSQLALALQFSQLIPDERNKATKAAMISSSKTVTEYIEKFRTALPNSTLASMKYSFSVFLVPRIANRAAAADVAVQFVRVDEASAEELSRLEKLNVLIREKHIPIANLGFHKPSDVVQELKKRLNWKLNMSMHTRAWRHFNVRPRSGDIAPAKTDPRYCVYDEVHEDYLYTDAWLNKLASDLADAAGFQAIIGQAPKQK